MRFYKRTGTNKKQQIEAGAYPKPVATMIDKGVPHEPAAKDEIIEIASDTDGMEKNPANAIVVDGSDIENSDESDVEVVDDMEVEDVDENGAAPHNQGPFPDPLKPVGNEKYPLANDHVHLAKRLMKPLLDYPVKDEAHYTWEITDWNAIRREEKVRGPQFECGGFRWNVLLFPRGSNDTVSVYMEPHPIVEADGTPDPAWYVCAQFALDIWNPQHPESHYPSGLSHRFNKSETDWGFSSFITSRDLASHTKVNLPHPILENNKLNITGYVRVIDDSSTGVLWHNFVDYDSKANTSYVGLNNQGATCYLNSLLQSYYTTRVFRDLVCQIPTDTLGDKSANNKAVALALQRIFYHLQLSKEPVGTLELTKSFGWDSSDAFTQHDVQELNRVLMDRLELAMKGTKIEKKLNDVFVGKMKSYIKCVNVPYESSREEEFWDIQLNVKGFKNLQESFENYIEVEMLDGENKYQAGELYGYQDAKKGVVFESFPPVLHLQLKRFEYDFMEDDLVKIDDLYEFPDKIDLSPYLDDDLPPDVKNENWNYKLHGVLVHQGSISNGHYYAMIKPEAESSTWLRFDDDKVWKATPTQVFQENFGAAELSPIQLRQLTRLEQNEYFLRRATSAYMLVYYRETELPQVLPTDLAPIPSHVAEQIDKEREELANWERMKREALFYMNVKIFTVDNFAYYNGFDIYPDPSKPKMYDANVFDKRAYPTSVIVRKEAKFSTLYKLVAKKLGYIEGDFEEEKIEDLSIEEVKDKQEEESATVDEEDDLSQYPFKLVPVKHRNNKTNRPDIAVPNDLAASSITQVYTKCFKRKYDEMVFFVEEPRKELSHIASSGNILAPESFDFDATAHRITSNSIEFIPADFNENDIHLFIKYFDPVTDEVRGLTYFAVPKDTVVSNLLAPINQLLQFDPKTPLEFFEEVSQSRIEPVDPELTLEKNELSSGDILTVQLAEVESAAFGKKFGNANDFYKFLLTRLHIHVKPCKTKDDEEDSDFVKEEKADSVDNVENANPEATEEKEIELAKEMSRSFDLWVSTDYSYQELANEIAQKLGDDTNPAYLRLFVVNSHGTRFPLSSTLNLSQVFTKQVAVSSITQFEYEILNITLKEYENMKSIKIYWLNSILQSHLLDLLVPKSSTVAEVIKKLIHKLEVPKEHWSNLLVWAGQENKYADLIKFDKPIDEINDQYEIYCGYFPAEVEILSSHDIFKRFDENYISASDIEDEVLRKEFEKAQQYSKLLNIIPVFHFYKTTSYVHSKPFVFAVYPDESTQETKERLRKKLGLGLQAFDKIKIALADMNDKGRYLDFEKPGVSLFEEVTKFDAHVSLALDHPDRNPRRANPFDKGISIR